MPEDVTSRRDRYFRWTAATILVYLLACQFHAGLPWAMGVVRQDGSELRALQLDPRCLSRAELALVPGLGEVVAGRLLCALRKQSGEEIDWAALRSIPGIGDATLAHLRRELRAVSPRVADH